MSAKIWFITGTSRGFGREWAIAALERGDKVAATARDTATLDDLVDASTATRCCRSGSTSPTATPTSPRSSRPTSTSGASTSSSTTRATASSASSRSCPRPTPATRSRRTCSARCGSPRPRCRILRAQRSGHIIQVSSIGGITAFPNVGIYHASKWALEGFSPGAGAGGRAVRHPRDADRAGRLRHRLGRLVGPARGAAARLRRRTARRRSASARAAATRCRAIRRPAAAVLEVVDAEEPPLRVFFGDGPLAIATPTTSRASRPGGSGSRCRSPRAAATDDRPERRRP